jgi:hypothetical protein
MEVFVALFALVMGVAMAAIWTLDIRAGRGFESSGRLIHAREVGTGSRLIWHWLAEYGTATTLIVAGLLLLLDAAVALPVAFIGLGALAYSACNSLSWALARPERRLYAVPMVVGLCGALISVAWLLSLG